jgi:L,D-peptidoglycan transpeptidase YkuD (ErfK/YbiS/YcfS/YnhG family)
VSRAAALAVCAWACGQPAAAPAGPRVIPADARQLVTGVIADWDATAVTLRRWRRADRGWVADGPAWRGVIGRGAAWGRGLHGDGPPAGRDGPRKREGDGKSPAGAFRLAGAYGYAARAPRTAQLPYTAVTADWECVDDPRSAHYTQILDRTRTTVDWASAEAMRRADALYTWVIAIAHNPGAVAGAGSCIFFHVWLDADTPTVGCTAMAEPAVARLVAELAPTAVYVLLPRADYDAFAAPWGLPRDEK